LKSAPASLAVGRKDESVVFTALTGTPEKPAMAAHPCHFFSVVFPGTHQTAIHEKIKNKLEKIGNCFAVILIFF